MSKCDGSEVMRPQNGTQAHDTSRELEFGRPARVGATPFWDRMTSEPALVNIRIIGSPAGDKNRQTKSMSRHKVLPMF